MLADDLINYNLLYCFQVLIVVLTLAYCGYVIAACAIDLKRAVPLVVISGLITAYLLYRVLSWRISTPIKNFYSSNIKGKLKAKASVIKW